MTMYPSRKQQGHDAAPLIGDEHPPRALAGWNGPRKAQIVAAIRDELVSAEEACERYGLTPEEIAAWERAFDSLGIRGRLKRSAAASE